MEAIGSNYIIELNEEENSENGFKVITNKSSNVARGKVISGSDFIGLDVLFDKRNALEYNGVYIVKHDSLLAIN